MSPGTRAARRVCRNSHAPSTAPGQPPNSACISAALVSPESVCVPGQRPDHPHPRCPVVHDLLLSSLCLLERSLVARSGSDYAERLGTNPIPSMPSRPGLDIIRHSALWVFSLALWACPRRRFFASRALSWTHSLEHVLARVCVVAVWAFVPWSGRTVVADSYGARVVPRLGRSGCGCSGC